MKQFTFRLERLLQLREAAEKDRARQLGDALREEEVRRLQLIAGQERLAEAQTQHSERPREMTQAGMLRNLDLTLEVLANQARTLEADHLKSLDRVNQERTLYEQARMAKRAIQRLREHRKEAWGVEVNRHEQSINDEAGQRSWGQEGE